MGGYKDTKRRKINRILLNENIKLKPAEKVILITIIIILIITIIITDITTKQSKNNQLAYVNNSIEMISVEQKNKLEDYVNNKIKILQYIASYKEIYGMDKSEQKRFIEGRSELLGFEHIFIVNTQGIGYYVDENILRDQKNEQFFFDIMSHDIFITKPYLTAQYDNIIMTLCVSLYNENNQKVGVLCGAINLFEMEKIFSENDVGINDICSLVDRKGNYIAAKDMDMVHRQVSIYDTKESDISLIKKAFQQKKTQMGTVILNNVEYQTCVSYLDMYDWTIVIGMKTNNILKDLDSIDTYEYYSAVLGILLILCIIRIIGSWYSNNKKINTDVLTKCNSRSAIESLIERLDNTKKYNVGVIYLDLNRFKEVNDTYGHNEGDKLLCVFSDVLMRVFRNDGFVGRIGGDEFVCFLIDTPEFVILDFLNKVELQLKEMNNKLNLDYSISFSYGIAFNEKGSSKSIRETIRKADKNMYENKKMNR